MKKSLAFFVFILALFTSISSLASTCALDRPDVQTYINQLVKKYDFDQSKLKQLFCTATLDKEVISRISKPAEAKPWYQYYDLFITPDRINKGVAYWKKHEQTLAQAEKKFGVPADIIVAIIGVETKYGENKGTFPVFNTLATLAFNKGRRADYFRSELTQYLLLTRENRLSPLNLKGSYAGAVGLPQFMPSSYRQYAVDFSNKGWADLFNDDADAIGSVGNYLSKHGWKTGDPVAVAANIECDECLPPIEKKFKPHLTQEDLDRYDITSTVPLGSRKCSFIQLENREGNEYWLGLQNFYVISTYNNSELYVMAVNVLAQKLREARTASST